ncbi:MAG: trehalose-phosphatase [Salegentibacter sp.]
MQHQITAGIFDMDGVITKTAKLHARAWKQMFDDYNEERRLEGHKTFQPFSIEEDYPKYVDGIPRYEGVREFLKSRQLDLPYGEPDDSPEMETLCGLGNQKNKVFLKILKDEGSEVFSENVEQIRNWKEQGLRTAIISSSKNCGEIIQSMGLRELFEVRIDGVDSAKQNIKGKPAPDIFLEAARRLGVSPSHTMIVEDAMAGVEAGHKGNFGLVVGIISGASKEELLQAGADMAVKNLQEVQIGVKRRHAPAELPSAMENIETLQAKFDKKKPLFFLDFDGTLAPIVERHEDAGMDDRMRELVGKLASEYSIAVISGRGLSDVKEKVGLENIYYAGSHGFEISGPGNFSKDNEEAQQVLPVFERLEPILKGKLAHIEGIRFERKKFTLAIHYRQVKEEQQSQVHLIVEKVLQDENQVIKGEGKKVIEIRPNIDWDKGKAVEMLKTKIDPEEKDPFAVYIGDDVTDEDAFEALQNGIGILVGDHGHETYANYSLKSVDEVKEFLARLV